MLKLVPGIGPANAKQALEYFEAQGNAVKSLAAFDAPQPAKMDWKSFCALLEKLADPATPWPGQVGLVREWYKPQLERIYDAAFSRFGDLEQLDHLSAQHASRERFLTELTLDPPSVTGDQSGAASKDEDYVILSTIHSAKGQEWDIVYVLNVADGNFPSEFSTGKPELIEEERRLLYVAMTRARNELHLCAPAQVPGHAAAEGRRCACVRRQEPVHDRQGARIPSSRRPTAACSGVETLRDAADIRHGGRCRAAQGNVVTKASARPNRRSGARSRYDALTDRSTESPDYQRRGPPPPPPPPPPDGLDRGARSWASFTRSGRPPIWKPFVC